MWFWSPDEKCVEKYPVLIWNDLYPDIVAVDTKCTTYQDGGKFSDQIVTNSDLYFRPDVPFFSFGCTLIHSLWLPKMHMFVVLTRQKISVGLVEVYNYFSSVFLRRL